jgi:hypothetical protein
MNQRGETIMLNPLRKLALAASLGAGVASFATVASALPVFDALAIRNAAPPTVEEVQWRWGWGWGAPVSAVRSLRPITATAPLVRATNVRYCSPIATELVRRDERQNRSSQT